MSDERREANDRIRARLGAPQSAPPRTPDAVTAAMAANRAALVSRDAQAIADTDAALTRAVEQASRAPAQPRDWGQGARGTRHEPSGADFMSNTIRAAMTGTR